MTEATKHESPLKNVRRCPAHVNGQVCDSAIFYDWGIQILETLSGQTASHGPGEGKFANYATAGNVKICARCTTPYILEDGELIDISSELTSEDVKLILSRGQSTLPHVKIKDP